MKILICLMLLGSFARADWTEKEKAEFNKAKAAHEAALKKGDKAALHREAVFKRDSQIAKVNHEANVDKIFDDAEKERHNFDSGLARHCEGYEDVNTAVDGHIKVECN